MFTFSLKLDDEAFQLYAFEIFEPFLHEEVIF